MELSMARSMLLRTNGAGVAIAICLGGMGSFQTGFPLRPKPQFGDFPFEERAVDSG